MSKINKAGICLSCKKKQWFTVGHCPACTKKLINKIDKLEKNKKRVKKS